MNIRIDPCCFLFDFSFLAPAGRVHSVSLTFGFHSQTLTQLAERRLAETLRLCLNLALTHALNFFKRMVQPFPSLLSWSYQSPYMCLDKLSTCTFAFTLCFASHSKLYIFGAMISAPIEFDIAQCAALIRPSQKHARGWSHFPVRHLLGMFGLCTLCQ